MTRTTTFTRGRGVYVCRLCNRRTRDDGDSVRARLCTECFELVGIENAIWGGAVVASDLAAIGVLRAAIVKRGGRDWWDEAMTSKAVARARETFDAGIEQIPDSFDRLAARLDWLLEYFERIVEHRQPE
jgi:hypothetical protein